MGASSSYYSTGPAATVLGISQPRLRRLCSSGVIDCETTGSGQFRIPLSEIERLKVEGLPPTPQRLRLPASQDAEYGHGLSQGLTKAAVPVEPIETAETLRAEAERLSAKRQLIEQREWFDQRDYEDQRRREEREAEIAANARQVKAEAERLRWSKSWCQYATGCVPRDAPDALHVEVWTNAAHSLETLPLLAPDDITQKLVDEIVERVLGPWRMQREYEAVVLTALQRFPETGWAIPAWHTAVTQRATDALTEFRRSTGPKHLEALRIALEPAVDAMTRQYEHELRCAAIASSVCCGLGPRTDAAYAELVARLGAESPSQTKAALLEIAEQVVKPHQEAERMRYREAFQKLGTLLRDIREHSR
jgi:hypothetical protein